jgi:hypothetical protein
MKPLAPHARRLVDTGRDQLGPDEAVVTRMRSRIAAGVAGGAVVAAATSSSHAAPTSVAGSTPATVAASAGASALHTTLLAVVAVAIAAGVATTIVVATRMDRPPAGARPEPSAGAQIMPSIPIPPPMDARPADQAGGVVAASAVSPQAALSPVAPISPPPRRRVEHPRVARPEPVQSVDTDAEPLATAAAPVPGLPPIATLARETELIQDATNAIKVHDLARAAADLEAYARETRGKGQLAAEAAAAGNELACARGDRDATDGTAGPSRPSSRRQVRGVRSCPEPAPAGGFQR